MCGYSLQNIGFCLDKYIKAIQHQHFHGLSMLKIKKTSFCPDIARISLLY